MNTKHLKFKLTLCFILLISCNNNGDTPNGTEIPPLVTNDYADVRGACRHKALIASVIYEESGFETRIMYGELNNDLGKYHVQAQAFINGQWEWLEVRYILVSVGEQDGFDPDKKYSTDEIYENCMSGVWY